MPRRILLGVLLAAVGLVWVLQGSGVLQGSSFMVGDPRWALAGLVALGVGLVVVLVSALRRR
jgi:drug/metabolite transporter (DMT)-like permease